MREKRYFCDWFDSLDSKRSNRIIVVAFIILMFIIGSVAGFKLHWNDVRGELDLYTEKQLEYLYQIPDRVIGENGINLKEMPNDVYEYEIIYNNDEIIFKFGIKHGERITVKMTKELEVLSKNPDFKSNEEYVKAVRNGSYAFGFTMSLILVFFIGVMFIIVYDFSKIKKHKNYLS